MDPAASTPERHGRRRPPSVFDALMCLSPPSPILDGSFPIAFSSDEIPVILFNSSPSDSDISVKRHSDYRSSIHSLAMTASSSADTIGTVGTFGPFRRRSSAQSNASSLGPCSEIQEDVDEHDIESEDCQESEIIQVSSPSAKPTSQEAHLTQTSGEPELPAANDNVANVSPPSPSPSVYSTLSCSSAPRPRVQVSSALRPISYSDSAGVLHSYMSTSTSMHTPRPLSPLVSSGSQRAPDQVPRPLPPQDKNSHLPSNIGWLKTTTVEMLIDQEGFRSAAPKFRFSGYSVRTDLAEFLPVSRQTFNFHYAPFEGQPVLRRLTTNEETRDYISRQATLCIKSNGVYTVGGTETPVFTAREREKAGHATESTKLRWKLDYFVDDKKGARTEGEKTFTPLTFCCSPLLLHPLQGKKIRLMHVVKKSVVMKLVAEKMLIPTPKLLPSLPLRDSDSSPAGLDSHYPQLPLVQMIINDDLKPSRIRRRRASSAGEDFQSYIDGTGPGLPKPRPISTGGKGLKQHYGHILPPSKLSEMLDDAGQENADPEPLVRALRPPPRKQQR